MEFPLFAEINYGRPLPGQGKFDTRYLKAAVAVKTPVENLKVLGIRV